VVFQRYDEDGEQHVWRINIDGTGLKQVTSGGGETLLDVTPDAKFIAFSRVDSTRGVWLQPLAGGEVATIAPLAVASQGLFSGDGQRAIVAELNEDGSGFIQTLVRVLRVPDGEELARFMSPPQAMDQDEGPGDSMSYLARNDPAWNIFTVSADGKQTTQITKFKNGRLTDHGWSPDFKRIAVVLRDDAGENLWVVDANGGNAKPVTSFDGEDVSAFKWTPDSRHVVVRAGRQSRDIVLMTNFE
jgi:Tol biopolymer transport system component